MRYSKKYLVKKPRKYRTKKTPVARHRIKKIVNSILSRKIETKLADVEFNDRIVYPVINQGDVYSLIPTAIAHGTGDGARVGNKLTVSRAVLKLSLAASYLGTGYGPTYFDMYIFKVKARVPMPPTNTEMAGFLDDAGSQTSYSGDPIDGLRQLNKSMFTLCLKKRVKLYNPLNGTAYYGSGSDIPQSKQFIINITKFFKKTWIYNDNFNTPYNDNLYLAFGATQTDNSVAPVGLGTANWSGIVELQYKDA